MSRRRSKGLRRLAKVRDTLHRHARSQLAGARQRVRQAHELRSGRGDTHVGVEIGGGVRARVDDDDVERLQKLAPRPPRPPLPPPGTAAPVRAADRAAPQLVRLAGGDGSGATAHGRLAAVLT